ncbi:helix-turn-helix domain-containing protein [Chryseobacterium sp. YIM B08800]|uniref:helix-turn-helix domain-containing protein n=1 Tax=Chryseobacterium sp. YIM B08800 TaxID=2984136 RepID=UPI00223F136B|nr:helix-turn-helix transcriptional regulator [Chryseobacterium sp. YIM B08800]
MEIGKKLREYRYRNNYSQQKVAELLDISQSTYCDWESDRSFPKAENLSKVAKLYDIDINDLLPTENPINIINSQNVISNSSNLRIETSEALLKVSEGLEKLIHVIEKMIEMKN